MAEALRAGRKPCEIPPVACMARSSCKYAGNALAKGEAEERAAARKAVVEAFGASGGAYGHRRITAMCVSSRGFEQKEHRKLSSLSIGGVHAI